MRNIASKVLNLKFIFLLLVGAVVPLTISGCVFPVDDIEIDGDIDTHDHDHDHDHHRGPHHRH